MKKKYLLFILTLLFILNLLSPQVSVANTISHSDSLNEGLVAYYKFDAGEGNIAYDYSSNGNDGTIIGASWISGALQFENAYVEIPTLFSSSPSSLTVSAWINPSSSDKGCIISHGKNGEFILYVDTGGATFQCKLGGNYYWADCEPLIPNVWHHLVGVWTKGASIKIYVNAWLADGMAVPDVYLGSRNMPASIGVLYRGEWAPSTFFEGTIDEIRVYDRALTEDEIRTLFFSGLIEIDKGYVSDGRADVGSLQSIGFHVKWINGSDVIGGDIYVNGTRYVTNGTGWINFNYRLKDVGIKTWTVTGVNVNGKASYHQTFSNLTIIWDKVLIMLKDSRIDVAGINVAVPYQAIYEYDGRPFAGTILLNDPTLSQDRRIGDKRRCKTIGIIDNNYGLSAFTTNEVYCIFDRILVETNFDTIAPGIVQAYLSLKFEYDNSPVEDATVRVNDVSAENLANGVYGVRLSSWMPSLTINIQIERAGFEPIRLETINYPVGNILVESSITILSVITMLRVNSRRIQKKKWHTNLRNLEELVKEKGRIKVEEASEATDIDIDNIKSLFSELVREKPTLQGFFINNDKEFILESALISSLNKMGKFEFGELSSDLGITTDLTKEIVGKLHGEGKIRGTFTLDKKGFITEDRLMDEIRKGL